MSTPDAKAIAKRIAQNRQVRQVARQIVAGRHVPPPLPPVVNISPPVVRLTVPENAIRVAPVNVEMVPTSDAPVKELRVVRDKIGRIQKLVIIRE